MTKQNYAFIIKFKMSERLPSYSNMESYVPKFVDAFFERRSTRVSKNAMEIWVHVNQPRHKDTIENITKMKERLDTPREELKYYESTLSLSSKDIDIAHMSVDKFVNQTEHSAAIANKNWRDIVFNVCYEDEFSYFLVQENNSNIKINVAKKHKSYDYNFEKEKVANIEEGQRIRATMGSESNATCNWYFNELKVV